VSRQKDEEGGRLTVCLVMVTAQASTLVIAPRWKLSWCPSFPCDLQAIEGVSLSYLNEAGLLKKKKKRPEELTP